MYKVRLAKAFKYYHNGFRPAVYGPGEVEDMPEDAARHALTIKGLVESMAPGIPSDAAGDIRPVEPPAPEMTDNDEPEREPETDEPPEESSGRRRNRR